MERRINDFDELCRRAYGESDDNRLALHLGGAGMRARVSVVAGFEAQTLLGGCALDTAVGVGIRKWQVAG